MWTSVLGGENGGGGARHVEISNENAVLLKIHCYGKGQ